MSSKLLAALLAGLAFAAAAQPAPPQIVARPTAMPRDPAQSLTLGELADAEERRLREDFLRARGVAAQRPAEAAPLPSVAAGKRAALQLRAAAIWGPPERLQAQLAIDGQLRPVAPGDVVHPGITITAIRPDGIELESRPAGGIRDGRRRRWLPLGDSAWVPTP